MLVHTMPCAHMTVAHTTVAHMTVAHMTVAHTTVTHMTVAHFTVTFNTRFESPASAMLGAQVHMIKKIFTLYSV